MAFGWPLVRALVHSRIEEHALFAAVLQGVALSLNQKLGVERQLHCDDEGSVRAGRPSLERAGGVKLSSTQRVMMGNQRLRM